MTASLSTLPDASFITSFHSRDGLIELDRDFCRQLQERDIALFNRLMAARADSAALTNREESELILALAPVLETFLTARFGIEAEMEALTLQHLVLQPLYACKRLFVQRQAIKKYGAADAESFDAAALEAQLSALIGAPLTEESFAAATQQWQAEDRQDALDIAARYAAWAVHTPSGRQRWKHGILFKLPRKLDPEHLVPVETILLDGVTMLQLPEHDRRLRRGFALTDAGADLKAALDQAHYCIFCHHQGKDSCSKGMREKDGGFKQSPTQVTLTGCPLEEKISEMNQLKSEGHALGALAVITIDNPMVAGTGHRICNDCMKSCIYQKQQPVDIPQVETRTLKDILSLPWGFEIYSLLTRWNPLNIRRPLPKPASGKRILVAGLGPAGYTLAHHLLNDGHTVVAVDGLKLEPLPERLSGRDALRQAVAFQPVRDIRELQEPLENRVGSGFGGVAEYGITVRWDKNFLTVLRLLLERRDSFAMFGGVRFGGTLTTEDAFRLGFHHIALCTGAGKPTMLDIPGNLVPGVRTASDFLMGLQLTGAGRQDSLANLQVRLPIVVIGGGLTAIDTATEALAYYPVQVEKFLHRYETLTREQGEEAVRRAWTPQEREIAEEFLAHARTLRDAQCQAAAEGCEADILPLLRQWGGATLAYRRRLQDAPSYRLNHEEVELALQEGIRFAENLTPREVVTDAHGHATALRCLHADGGERLLPARTVLMAAGTQPNTSIAREDPDGYYPLNGLYFQAVDAEGRPVTPGRTAKPDEPQMLLHADRARHRSISFWGDLHPSYAGNVVKAMGSAKQGYPSISRLLEQAPAAEGSERAFLETLRRQFVAVVERVERLTPTILEVVVRAPMAARHFEPGQFYRLQNYERLADLRDGSRLSMEGLALTGAWVDKEAGLLSTIVLEMGGSSSLCARLQPGEPVVLMGPTGAPTHIPSGETVLLIGGGLGNAVLFSIGKALKAHGCRVLYFAGYRKAEDRYKIAEIEAASDLVIWCCDEAADYAPSRPDDRFYHGNLVQAMLAYAQGGTGPTPIPLAEVERLIVIGSDRMMAAVKDARHTVLKPWLGGCRSALASINSPMQCMMKEICAQCLQRHIDPETGAETIVYSCFNQDQALDRVDFANLRDRLSQNSLQEKLTALWLHRLLDGNVARR